MALEHLDLALFCCPKCRGSLVAGPDASAVACQSCLATYPVERGIPRFAKDSYVETFGRQWNRYDVARDEEDEAVFEVKTGWKPSALAGKLVLDAGCGGGRYARLLAKVGANIVGVDLSSAVEKAAALCQEYPNATIAQGDLFQLPFRDGTFDFAFSIGVMHHSPDPRRAFHEVARCLKPGGSLAVWLYRKNTWPQEVLNNGLRAVSTRLPARVLEPICVGMGVLGSLPVLNKTLNKVANFSNHPDWTLRICDNYDWYAPRFQSHHTVDELRGWFSEEGFENLETLPPARAGRFYHWAYNHDLIIGSGVNVMGRKK